MEVRGARPKKYLACFYCGKRAMMMAEYDVRTFIRAVCLIEFALTRGRNLWYSNKTDFIRKFY